MRTLQTVVISVASCAVLAVHLAGQAKVQTIQGPELEEFLKSAKLVSFTEIGKGVTRSRKANLELNGVTEGALFKIIDEKPMSGITTLEDGRIDAEFQDSWKTEVAAYELDKMIGLGMVAATVERRLGTQVGSLQFWVTSVMTEKKRQKDNVRPSDPQAWNDQMNKLFVWDNLIFNVDRNLDNILITEQWTMIAIDHSRTFRPHARLQNPKQLTRFSRSLLAKLEQLKEPELKARMGNYLSPFQIQGMLKRRDLILAAAKKLVAEKGEAAVMYQ
jgi:hypothetical protein